MNKDELLDLVNEKDEVIGEVWKSEAHKDPSKIHREVAIAIFNKKGQVLLQRRSMNKKHHPGRWAITAGHIGKGEEPKIAASRELCEEFGWENELEYLGKMYATDLKEARIFWIYYLVVDNSPIPDFDKKEVMEVKWVDFNSLSLFAEKNEYYLTGTTHKILVKVAKMLGL